MASVWNPEQGVRVRQGSRYGNVDDKGEKGLKRKRERPQCTIYTWVKCSVSSSEEDFEKYWRVGVGDGGTTVPTRIWKMIV